MLKEKIIPELNQFIGNAYEEIALQWMQQQQKFHNYILGRWWDRVQEIDIVGIDKEHNKIIFGEVKWKSLSEKEARRILADLKEKSELVLWKENALKTFLLIGKRIEGKAALQKEGYEIFDITDIAKDINNQTRKSLAE